MNNITSTYPNPLDTIGHCRSTNTDVKREDLGSIDPGSTVDRQAEGDHILLVYQHQKRNYGLVTGGRLTRKKNATDAEEVFALLSKMEIIIMEKPIPVNPTIKVFLRPILSSASDGSNEDNMKTI